MRILAVLVTLFLAGCMVPGPAPESREPAVPVAARAETAAALREYREVVARVEPVATRMCRERRPDARCDFRFLVDDRPGQPINAFQTLERDGRPVVVLTLSLIADAANPDELAFVLGHETGHHIAGHIPRQQTSAMAGALVLGTLASLGGATTPEAVDQAARLGATLGARVYSKEHELEADALGAVIAFRAGYDPILGSAFFNRLPDPGNRFLGTHPPHAERIAVVRRTVAQLRGERL